MPIHPEMKSPPTSADPPASTKTLPRILTTVVGSYPVPDWLIALPSEQALVDATRAIFNVQEMAGIDLVADGELYRFDPNHPDTNGMIDYFVRPLAGVRSQIGRGDVEAFSKISGMQFRRRPAGVVEKKLDEGALDLPGDFARARQLTRSLLKFTVTGPHMLTRTLLNRHYSEIADAAMDLARVLAGQIAVIDADVVQIDEANITGHPEDAAWAIPAINTVLDSIQRTRALHLCFGNYGGQVIQTGTWTRLIDFMNQLHVDHVILEMSRRGPEELAALKDLRPEIGIGLGVIDIKTTLVETADEVARRLDLAEKKLGVGKVQYAHPDCGFWMLKRSIADRKIATLVQGRNLYLGTAGMNY